MNSIARIVSLTILATVMVFVGISFFHVIAPFLMPLFLAAVASILSQPLFHHFMNRVKGKKRIAAGVTTATILVAILLPIALGISLATAELYKYVYVTMKDQQWKEDVAAYIHKLPFKELDELVSPFLEGTKRKIVSDESLSAGDKQADSGSPKSEEDQQESTESKDSDSNPEEETDSPSDESSEGDKQEPDPESKESAPSESESENEKSEAEKESEEKQSQEYEDLVSKVVDSMGEDLKATLLSVAQRSAGFAGTAITGFISFLVTSAVGIVIFVVALYYFLADGPALVEATQDLIPVQVPYQNELIDRFEKTVRSVVSATMLSAIAQGVTTALMLTLFVKTPFFIIFILSTITAMVPLIGTWVIWVPYAIGLLLQKEPAWVASISMFVIGGVGIGTMDNVIRTYVLQNNIRLHPLLALVSVLGGIQAMGLWGVFIGPIVASCLYALVRMFNVELKELSGVQMDIKLKDKKKDQEEDPSDTVEKSKESEEGKSAKAEGTKGSSKETKKDEKENQKDSKDKS